MLSNGRRAVAGLGRRVTVQGAQRLQTGSTSSFLPSTPALSTTSIPREVAMPLTKNATQVWSVVQNVCFSAQSVQKCVWQLCNNKFPAQLLATTSAQTQIRCFSSHPPHVKVIVDLLSSCDQFNQNQICPHHYAFAYTHVCVLIQVLISLWLFLILIVEDGTTVSPQKSTVFPGTKKLVQFCSTFLRVPLHAAQKVTFCRPLVGVILSVNISCTPFPIATYRLHVDHNRDYTWGRQKYWPKKGLHSPRLKFWEFTVLWCSTVRI